MTLLRIGFSLIVAAMLIGAGDGPPPFPLKDSPDLDYAYADKFCVLAARPTCASHSQSVRSDVMALWANPYTTDDDRLSLSSIIESARQGGVIDWFAVKQHYLVELTLRRATAEVRAHPERHPTPPPTDYRFCWMDYCPCGDEVNALDHGICRDLKAGIAVDKQFMSSAARLHDLQKESDQYNRDHPIPN